MDPLRALVRFLDLLAARREATVGELAPLAGCSEGTARRRLGELFDRGLVARRQVGSAYLWSRLPVDGAYRAVPAPPARMSAEPPPPELAASRIAELTRQAARARAAELPGPALLARIRRLAAQGRRERAEEYGAA